MGRREAGTLAFKKNYLFIHLFLALLGLHRFVRFSLVAVNGGYSLVVVLGLLFAVASLVVEHELQTHRLQ